MKKNAGDNRAEQISSRKTTVGVVGLGYVGLPLCISFAKAGFPVIGYDMDAEKTANVNAGKQYIKHISVADMKAIAGNGGFATTDPAMLAKADAILICVPTPLTKHRDPDMRYVVDTAKMLSKIVRPGHLIVLESTTYPGTSRDVLLPHLEAGGLKGGRDFHLAYSPEREDPGGGGLSTGEIPKVMGGLTPACLEKARTLYGAVVPETVPVSSLETAEATKLLENIFRSVNIALVNELKQVFAHMEIDIWEVIEAAKTKPFGFMPFYPGPGLGGHCIPIDPFYLTWKAREYECPTRFIELAGEINVAMPAYVVSRTGEELNRRRKSIGGSKILLLGAAYKKNVDDVRESPSLKLIELFQKLGAGVKYHDPFIPRLKPTRTSNLQLASVPLTADSIRDSDAVVIATDHDDVDYRLVAEHADLIIDTRNVMRSFTRDGSRVAKA